MKYHRTCTCNRCGWVHMAVTREHAEKEVKEFNAWYDTQPPEIQEHFGRPASVERDYDRCFLCGPGATFRPFQDGDCPDGVTIQPAIYEP